MTNNKGKGKLRLILLAFVVLAMMSVACNGTDNDTPTATPTPQVITGDVTADAIIEDTIEAVESGVSTLCKACLIAEKLGGDACNCNAICDTDLVCEGE